MGTYAVIYVYLKPHLLCITYFLINNTKYIIISKIVTFNMLYSFRQCYKGKEESFISYYFSFFSKTTYPQLLLFVVCSGAASFLVDVYDHLADENFPSVTRCE